LASENILTNGFNVWGHRERKDTIMSNEAKANLERTIVELGSTIESTFVPWSLSRNAGEKDPSLNWKIRLLHNGKLVTETDYMAGCGHCPSYRQGKLTVADWQTVTKECETGKSTWAHAVPYRILPDATDVIYSLVSNSNVLDYPEFEQWASDYGYSEDSREAEKIYRACLKIALAIRNAVGDDGLKRLNEASQDY
jgi:hypothetical protein